MLRLIPHSLLLLLLSFALGCRPLKTSSLQDIYRADQSSSSTNGNERRHGATADEILWTVHLTGCSGILLTPQYLLTAAHCSVKVGDKMRSGWSILTNGAIDLEVVSVLESSTELDYSLLEIRWLSPMSKTQPFPPRIATAMTDVYMSAQANEGDELFTVGFPDDRSGIWPSTYSQGQAKTLKGTQLYFNVGIINGSSGGGVLKKETQMLVSLANGGRHAFGQAGWDKADVNDPDSWNYGTPLWAIHAQSKGLQRLFPNGANAYYNGNFLAKTQIYLALASQNNQIGLWLAASDQVQEILICPGLVTDCTRNKSGVVSASIEGYGRGRAFYRSPLGPESLNTMTAVALDKDGAIIGQRQATLQKGS